VRRAGAAPPERAGERAALVCPPPSARWRPAAVAGHARRRALLAADAPRAPQDKLLLAQKIKPRAGKLSRTAIAVTCVTFVALSAALFLAVKMYQARPRPRPPARRARASRPAGGRAGTRPRVSGTGRARISCAGAACVGTSLGGTALGSGGYN